MHPDWGLTIWDDSKVATLELRNQRAYKRASNYAMMSDILRYEVRYALALSYRHWPAFCLFRVDSGKRGWCLR